MTTGPADPLRRRRGAAVAVACAVVAVVAASVKAQSTMEECNSLLSASDCLADEYCAWTLALDSDTYVQSCTTCQSLATSEARCLGNCAYYDAETGYCGPAPQTPAPTLAPVNQITSFVATQGALAFEMENTVLTSSMKSALEAAVAEAVGAESVMLGDIEGDNCGEAPLCGDDAAMISSVTNWSAVVALPELEQCCPAQDTVRTEDCQSAVDLAAGACRSVGLLEAFCEDIDDDNDRCLALREPENYNASLAIIVGIRTPGVEEPCCNQCTCYGDPNCVSFDNANVSTSWRLCDGRDTRTNKACDITEYACLQRTDHVGNPCVWKQDWDSFWQSGSKCQVDEDSPESWLTMYEADDFRFAISQGERGVIRSVNMTTASGSFFMSAEDCIEGSSLGDTWTWTGGNMADAPSFTRGWSRNPQETFDVLWYVRDGNTGIFSVIRCTGTVNPNNKKRYGNYRINVETLVEPDDFSERSGLGGFCYTGAIADDSDPLALASYEEHLAVESICQEIQIPWSESEALEYGRLFCGPGLSATGLNQCFDSFCDGYSFPNADADECKEIFADRELAEGFCLVTSSLASAREKCVKNIQDFGHEQVIEDYFTTLESGESTECISSIADLPVSLSSCQQGVTLQYQDENGEWVDYVAIPDTVQLCDSQLEVLATSDVTLFTSALRFVQCSLSASCSSTDQCQTVSGIDARFEYFINTVRPTPQPTAEPTLTPGSTLEPTFQPSFSPSTESRPPSPPTNTPTLAPTRSPNEDSSPTLKPTAFPTAFPTAYPTNFPTSTPTTSEPTERPTQSPAPTRSPNEDSSPTLKPTAFPTAFPTAYPTNFPTSTPTTSEPTVRPTQRPTSYPTMPPASTPTPKPTPSPTEPTPYPTSRPPTMNPTPRPTTSTPSVDRCGIECPADTAAPEPVFGERVDTSVCSASVEIFQNDLDPSAYCECDMTADGAVVDDGNGGSYIDLTVACPALISSDQTQTMELACQLACYRATDGECQVWEINWRTQHCNMYSCGDATPTFEVANDHSAGHTCDFVAVPTPEPTDWTARRLLDARGTSRNLLSARDHEEARKKRTRGGRELFEAGLEEARKKRTRGDRDLLEDDDDFEEARKKRTRGGRDLLEGDADFEEARKKRTRGDRDLLEAVDRAEEARRKRPSPRDRTLAQVSISSQRRKLAERPTTQVNLQFFALFSGTSDQESSTLKVSESTSSVQNAIASTLSATGDFGDVVVDFVGQSPSYKVDGIRFPIGYDASQQSSASFLNAVCKALAKTIAKRTSLSRVYCGTKLINFRSIEDEAGDLVVMYRIENVEQGKIQKMLKTNRGQNELKRQLAKSDIEYIKILSAAMPDYPEADDGGGDSSNTLAIALGTVGAVSFIALATLFVMLRRRSKRQTSMSSDEKLWRMVAYLSARGD